LRKGKPNSTNAQCGRPQSEPVKVLTLGQYVSTFASTTLVQLKPDAMTDEGLSAGPSGQSGHPAWLHGARRLGSAMNASEGGFLPSQRGPGMAGLDELRSLIGKRSFFNKLAD
jgi:hypothetical protein